MRKILLVALAAAAMVSCSENEEFENGSTANRIQFGTVVKTGKGGKTKRVNMWSV